MPSPAMVQRERPTRELFQQPLFKKMRRELYGDEEASEYGTGSLRPPMVEPELNQSLFASDGAPSRLMSQIACTIEIDLPERLSEWKRMSRSPHSFYA